MLIYLMELINRNNQMISSLNKVKVYLWSSCGQILNKFRKLLWNFKNYIKILKGILVLLQRDVSHLKSLLKILEILY